MGNFSQLVDSLKLAVSPGDSRSGHPGELFMRRRYPSVFQDNEEGAEKIVRDRISPSLARFIEDQKFFFIATANAHGHCDASFRGREYSAFGEPLPAVLLIDEFHLAFPDYPGNGLYNSLGNIAANPHIGMLFIDFERQRRARVNGNTSILPANTEINRTWPLAQSVIVVRVEQAFGNCSARIPKLVALPESDLFE